MYESGGPGITGTRQPIKPANRQMTDNMYNTISIKTLLNLHLIISC